MASTHLFPILTIDQIVVTCRDMKIPVTENDIRKPDVTRWCSILSTFFEFLSGNPADQVRQQQLNILPDYPELHEESLPLIAFVLAMQRVMFACEFTDFNIRDVIEPQPKRIIRILSATINMIHFRAARLEFFQETQSKNERYREQYDYLVKSNAELKDKLVNLKATRAEEEPEIRKAQESMEEKINKVSDAYKFQAAIQKNVSELKTSIAEKKAKHDQLKVAILVRQQDSEKLSHKIVQSPERVRQEAEGMEQKVDALKLKLDAKRTHGSMLQFEHKKVKALEANAEKVLKLLHSGKQDLDKKNEIEAEMIAYQDRHHERQQSLHELSSKHDYMVHAIAMRREKQEQQRMQHQPKNDSLKQQLLHLDSDVKVQSGGQEDQTRKLVQATQQIIVDLQKQEKVTANNVELLHKAYSSLVMHMESKHVTLSTQWMSLREYLRSYLQDLNAKLQ